MDWRWALFITGAMLAFGGLFPAIGLSYPTTPKAKIVSAVITPIAITLTIVGAASMLFAILHGLWSSVEW
jgi:hypothetical protein